MKTEIQMQKRYCNSHAFALMAYKDSPYIERCIRSLLDQLCQSSIYITTSTPSDYIRSIADTYRVALHINPGSGIASDWSFAFRTCDRPYVTLAHQDDIYHRDYVLKVISAMKKRPQALMAFTDYQELHKGGIIRNNLNLVIKRILLLPYYLRQSISSGAIRRATLFLGSPICCPSVTYNKNLLAGFCFNESFSINPDWDAWLRLCEIKGYFTFLPDILMTHSIHKNSETTKGLSENKRQNEDLQIFQSLWGKNTGKQIASLYALSYKSNSR